MLDTAGARSKARKKSGRQGQKAGRSPLPSPPKDRQTTLPKQSTTQKITASAAMAKPLVIKPALLNPCLAPISPSLSPELPHTAPLMSTDHSQDDSSGDRLAQLETRGTGILKYARSLGTFREGKVATFDNGMRTSSEGHGRMNKDYCGVVLPLLPAYGPDGKGPHSAPWMVQGEIYELLLDGYSRLDVEIHDFMSYMARSDGEIRGRELCKTRAIGVVKEFVGSDSEHQINIYGSERTALGLPLSDIDITIDIPTLGDPSNPYAARERYIPALRELGKLFEARAIVNRIIVREGNIPLLEIEDADTGIEIDISFDEKTGTSSSSSIEQVKRWRAKYGEQRLLPLVVLLKHALGMRQLGLGTATELYQGGVGSYLILCMVVVFLERQENQSKENTTSSSNGEQNQNISHLLLGLLRLWGIDFDYEKQGITMDPPQIAPKSKGIEPYIFEVRRDSRPVHNHLGSGTFGIKHIKETLKFFHNTLLDEIHLYNKRILAGEAKIIDNNKLSAKNHAILGILGTIMGGRYQWFEERRRQIVRAADKHDRPSALPPHRRLQIGRHHQRSTRA